MADFCKQCSIDVFGKDTKDMADDTLPDGHVMLALCEDCGMTYVNAAGECVTDCDKHHAPAVKP